MEKKLVVNGAVKGVPLLRTKPGKTRAAQTHTSQHQQQRNRRTIISSPFPGGPRKPQQKLDDTFCVPPRPTTEEAHQKEIQQYPG